MRSAGSGGGTSAVTQVAAVQVVAAQVAATKKGEAEKGEQAARRLRTPRGPHLRRGGVVGRRWQWGALARGAYRRSSRS